MSDTSASQDRSEPDIGISDDQLPEDLVPSEDNPLAVGLEPGERVDDLLVSDKPVERSEPDGPGGAEDDSRPDDGSGDDAQDEGSGSTS